MLLSDFDKKYNLQPVPSQEEMDIQNIPSVYRNVAPKADNVFLSTSKNIGKGIAKDLITQPIRATQALSALGSEVIGGKVGDKLAQYAFNDLETPVGTIPKIEQGMTGVGQGVGEGLKTLSYAPLSGMGTSAITKGITSGVVGGATYGAGEALSNKDTQNTGSVLQNTIMGGTVGGILGGAVSGVTKGVSSYLAKRAEKQGAIKILSDKTLAQKESEALNSHVADLLSPDKVDDFAKTRFGFDDPTFLRDKTGKLDEAVFGELKDEVSKEVSQNIPFSGAKDVFDNAIKGKPLTEDTLKQAYIDTVNKFRIVDPKTALYKVEKGRLVSDKNAKDLIKSGIPVADIQVAKSGNTQERKLFSQMLDTAEERVNNPTFNDRVLKPVADDLIKTYDKYVVQTGKKIGKTLGDMRASFEGKKISVDPVMSAYDNMLSELGIAKNPKTGEILFGNSPLRNSEKMMQVITKVDDEISRLNAGKTAKNADVVADALRQITQDEPAVQGTYAQRLIGQIKTAIDDTIDSSVSGYKQIKKEFAMNKQIQDELESIFGAKFDVNDANRGAELLRRLESNAGARIDNIVSAIQDEAERHGYTGVNFKGLVRLGSTLEKVTGNVPRNSLEGIGERVMGGAMQGVEMAKDLATGNITGLAKKGVELTAKGGKQLEPLEYIAKLRELNNTFNDFKR